MGVPNRWNTSWSATVTDRLGSTRVFGSPNTSYYPYGEEYSTTTQDRPKFGTYYRDQTTALDYAQNRYYSSTLGRFLTADPYRNSAGPGDPGSWNRYAYVGNDPVNFNDVSGEDACAVGQPVPCEVTITLGSGRTTIGLGGGGASLGHTPSLAVPPDFQFGFAGGGPSLPGLIGATKGQQKAFKKALEEALRLLESKKHPDCGKLFGGQVGINDLEDATYKEDVIIGIEGTNPEAIPAATDPSSQTVTINILGHFFSQVQTVSDPHTHQPVQIDWGYRTGLTGTDFQALILLHELGHLTGKFGPDKDRGTNDFYTNKVLEDCFGKELKPPQQP